MMRVGVTKSAVCGIRDIFASPAVGGSELVHVAVCFYRFRGGKHTRYFRTC